MLTIIASKKALPRAVDRNRARRRIRAALDLLKPDWRQTLSGKLFASRETIGLPLPALRAKIKHALSL